MNRARRLSVMAWMGVAALLVFIPACGTKSGGAATDAGATEGGVGGIAGTNGAGAGGKSAGGAGTGGAGLSSVGGMSGAAAGGAASAGSSGSSTIDAAVGDGAADGPVIPGPVADATVVLFLVDGMTTEAVQTAIGAGASHFKLLWDEGVRVEVAHSTSPAAVIQLPQGAPGGTQPWARATSGNVAVHTGCHLFESKQMDDIFLAARAGGLKSVYSGGDDNYAIFTTADFHYGMMMDDATTVQLAVDHLKKDKVRLLRLHLQRVRDFWKGPADKTNPASAYIQQLLVVDRLLGDLVDALTDAGVWDRTYLVVAADHGMGQAASSTHQASTASSWNPFMAFRGPRLKRGTTIPYAELPDIAVTTVALLGLPPLRGHLDPAVTLPVRGPTGTLLTNLFEGAPRDLAHPRYIEQCLAKGQSCTSASDDYAPYRQTMLNLIR